MISDLEISGGSDSNSLKESESLKVLRAVRVLRPLKIVSGIPSERTDFCLVFSFFTPRTGTSADFGQSEQRYGLVTQYPRQSLNLLSLNAQFRIKN